MEIEEFEEDDDGIISNFEETLELSKNKLSEPLTSIKIRKYFLDDKKSQEESNKKQENLTTEDERNYVEMSPRKRFGRFDEEIGISSNTKVYRGFDFNQGREVSWKVINVSEMDQSEFINISLEIKTMKYLNHANIIKYISSWYNKNKKDVVIITEITCGGSIKKQLMKLQNPRLRLIKNWIKEILKGLKYLHHEVDPAITHRDIKSENIFIDSTNGTVKLGDLGLTRIVNKYLIGSEANFGADVVNGKLSISYDIYSLGICILDIVVSLDKQSLDKLNNDYYNSEYQHLKKLNIKASIEKIKNIELKRFILSCLNHESQRPNAIELLSDSFLNETESEENNRPIELIEELSEPKINGNFHLLLDQSKNLKSVNKIISHTQLCNDFTESKNLENEIYDIDTQKYSLSEISKKSLYKKTNYPNSVRNLQELNKYSPPRSSTNNLFDLKNEKVDSKMNIISKKNINITTLDESKLKIKVLETKNLLKFNQPLTHKNNVILQNVSLNKNNLCSKFEINISESKEDILFANLSKNSAKDDKKEIHINFLVHKEEWINKRQIITFNYDLFNDTIQGVVQELQKAIGLNEVEFDIVYKKLNEFLNPFKSAIEAQIIAEKIKMNQADVDNENVIKIKKEIENFSISFNKLMRKILNLSVNDNTSKLEDFRNKYLNSFNSFKDPGVSKMVQEYIKKVDHLNKILKLNEENIKANKI